METSDSASASPSAVPVSGEAGEPSRADQLLVIVFWVWAALLAVATLAQLFGWEQVLDLLDVKRWF